MDGETGLGKEWTKDACLRTEAWLHGEGRVDGALPCYDGPDFLLPQFVPLRNLPPGGVAHFAPVMLGGFVAFASSQFESSDYLEQNTLLKNLKARVRRIRY